MREGDAGYRIIDVVAEGVSLAVTTRNEFGAIVSQDGIDGLLAQLRERRAHAIYSSNRRRSPQGLVLVSLAGANAVRPPVSDTKGRSGHALPGPNRERMIVLCREA